VETLHRDEAAIVSTAGGSTEVDAGRVSYSDLREGVEGEGAFS
jgi:hypothetical protein